LAPCDPTPFVGASALMLCAEVLRAEVFRAEVSHTRGNTAAMT
jgi:hypothetical protein